MSKQDFAAKNIQAIASYFQSGSQNPLEPLLGVEIEHPVMDRPRARTLSYLGDGFGVKDILEALSKDYPKKGYEGDDLLSLDAADANITLEPAAQLEISIAPYTKLAQIKKAYRRFEKALEPIVKEHEFKLVNHGYNPIDKAEDLTLIPKKRYDFMDRYFHEIGSLGHYMMRASGSTQVSINYKDEKDALTKLRVACLLAPIFAAMADNSPIYEGAPNTERIRRYALWRQVDPERCQVVPGLFDSNFSFEEYARKLYNVAPIFIQQQGEEIWTGQKKAKEIYTDRVMSEKEIEHLTSLTWPDVRLKKFIEIRPADSLPIDLALGYAALIKGLFYDKKNLERLKNTFSKEDQWLYNEKDIEAAITEIQSHGLQADLYGKSLQTWIDELSLLALEVLDPEEREYLNKFTDFAQNKPWLGKNKE